MVVLNWFKETLENGHKLFLKSLNYSTGQSQAKQNLIRQQRALAEHFRKSTESFMDKLENLTQKIADSGTDARSFEYIKNRQQALFYACLRLDIGLKNNSELRRERKEWERRLPCTEEINAYHPLIRLELIDSELRVREERLMDQKAETPVFQNQAPVPDITSENKNEQVSAPSQSKQDSSAVSLQSAYQANIKLDTPDQDYILRHAEEILIELSSEHNNVLSGHEFSEKSAELRDLHKMLNKLRSSNRAREYRTRLRTRMSRLFS